MDYGLGVDLGVSFTAAAVMKAGRAEMIVLGDRSTAVPSVAYARPDGQLVTGDAAERRAAEDPSNLAWEVKRRLGDPTPLVLGGRAYPPAVLLAAMLRDVLATAERQEGTAPSEVLLTCPAVWGPYRREQFAEVARLAGLHGFRTVTEPEAAAAHYAAARQLADGETVLLFDLGGGTLDTTVLRARPGGVDVLGPPDGLEHLGGADIDRVVYDHVGTVLEGTLDRLDPADPRTVAALARLRRDCALAKETLSVEAEAVIPVFLPGGHREVRLSRDRFEELIDPIVRAAVGTALHTLNGAGVAPKNLTAVLLTGGSSRIPLLGRALQDELDRPLRTELHPKHAVALGAAGLSRIPTGPPAPAHDTVGSGATQPPPAVPAGRRRRAATATAYVLAAAMLATLLAIVLLRDAGTADPTATTAADLRPDGEWRLDEGSGSLLADLSGNAHDLTLTGAVSWVQEQEAWALCFSGTSGVAASSEPVVDTADSFTVAAWVKLDRSNPDFITAVSQSAGPTSVFFLQYVGSVQRFAFSLVPNDPADAARSTARLPPRYGVWTHLVGVWDAGRGQAQLFVDGQPQEPIDFVLRRPSDGPLLIGRAALDGRPVDAWPGCVDHVRTYQRALPATQIALLQGQGR